MEIERRFLLNHFDGAGLERSEVEQVYISAEPVIRLRRRDGAFWLTVKGKGLMAREEFELAITGEQYERLKGKAEPGEIQKTRYLAPLEGGPVAEVDVFHGRLAPLMMVEVEFKDEGAARGFVPPDWFGREVTEDGRYANSCLARLGVPGEGKG